MNKEQSQSAKKQKLNFLYNEQREFREIDSIIEALEVQIQTLSREIEASSSDYDALTRLLKEKKNQNNCWNKKWNVGFICTIWLSKLSTKKQ